MSVDDFAASGSSIDLPALTGVHDAGPLGLLPRVSSRQARVASRLARLGDGHGLGAVLGWLSPKLGSSVVAGKPDVVWRPSGLRRTGLVAEFHWPRLSTRFGVGLATPLAHAVVDRLLGFSRFPEEGRLPISTVEWGVLTFVVAETLNRLSSLPAGPLGAWDPSIDRVGPDPFDPEGLGRVVTLRWPLLLGKVSGTLRLWLPETLLARWLVSDPPPASTPLGVKGAAELSGTWRAAAGTIALPRGLKTLRPGGVLPLADSALRGTPENPSGPVALTLNAGDKGGLFQILTKPVPSSSAARLLVVAPVRSEPSPRESIALQPTEPRDHSAPAAEVPVTLVVELGRVNLSLGRLADLKPGDVIELGRHSREPVELTSGGRLVARGELVQIDTELGVRVTNVFL